MIPVRVENLQAFAPVTIRLDGQPDIQIEFVVDTGFQGALTLPVSAIQSLKLPYVSDITATLADNTSVDVQVFEAKVMWHEADRNVAVLAMGLRPLIGTALFENSNLSIDFRDGGNASITPL